jgi:hypothetical protein
MLKFRFAKLLPAARLGNANQATAKAYCEQGAVTVNGIYDPITIRIRSRQLAQVREKLSHGASGR